MHVRRIIVFLLFITLCTVCKSAFCQAPSISYPTPQRYPVNSTITTLLPVNTGGQASANVNAQVSTFAGMHNMAGFLDGIGNAARLSAPEFPILDAAGDIYFSDVGHQAIRKITPSGTVTTLAGTGTHGGTDGPSSIAQFSQPAGLAFDTIGNLFIADANNNKIRKLTPSGIVSTYAGTGNKGYTNGQANQVSFYYPISLAFDKRGNLYVTDGVLIRKIAPDGLVSTFAGNLNTNAFLNGFRTQATFKFPAGLAFDKAGNLYVADVGNYMIRKIDTAGNVTTFAGNGVAGFVDGSGTGASLDNPFGLAIDDNENLYFTESKVNRIRKVTHAGVVVTIAGNTGASGFADGPGPLATFNYPLSICSDGQGLLYVADDINETIRKIVLTSGYSIDKPLPAGLKFDITTGAISGTPTVASPATDYTVTAFNTTGTSTTIINITTYQPFVLLPSIITFPPPTLVLDANGDFDPGATSTNKQTPITYTSSNPAVAIVLPNGLIHVVAVGSSVITASQTGNGVYAAAIPVIETLYITQQEVIYFTSLPPVYTGDPDFNPGATTNVSAFPVTYTSSNPAVATIVNGQVHVVGAGTTTIMASQAGNTLYIAASPVSQTLTVNPALTFNPLPVKYTCDTNFDPGATGKATITYTSSNTAAATIIAGKIHITGTGTSTITAINGNATLTQILTVNTVQQPVVSITSSVPFPLCAGSTVSFTAATTNAGTNPSYQWQVNGVNSGNNTPGFSPGTLNNNDLVTCIVTNSSAPCSPFTSSNVLSVQITPINIATISIAPQANAPVCAGTPLTFNATITNGGSAPAYRWQVNGKSQGNNQKSFTVILNDGDLVTCMLTSSNVCSPPVSSQAVTARVAAAPVITLNDITIKNGDEVRLNPMITGVIKSYLWSPSTGLSDATQANPFASPKVNTTYTLHAISSDGCDAFGNITVNVIQDIIIFNTFTPNGDGTNDTWAIPALIYYPNCTVDIYNRNGSPVFHSLGYGTAWDGTLNNQPLPVGSYYYMINLKYYKKPSLSGSITIVR